MKRSVVLLGLTGMLPITVLVSGFAFSSLQAERDSLSRRATGLSIFSATLLERELEAQARAVRMVAQSPTFDDGIDEQRFRLLAARLMENDPDWHALTVTTPEARRVMAVAPGADLTGQTVVDPASVRQAVSTRGTVVGDIVSQQGGVQAFAVRAPVIRQGEVRFVVSAVLPADALKPLLVLEELPEGWRSIVVDHAGQEATSVGAVPGGRMRSFSTSIPSTRWSVQIEVPEGAFVRLNHRARAILLGGTTLALMLFAGLAWVLHRRLQALRAAEAAAVHANKLEALGRLTGGVAHDLNNLLTPVIGGLDLLKRRLQGDEKALRLITNADLSAERARKLVARLLAFSRTQELSWQAIPLVDLLEGMRDLLTQSLGPSCQLELVVALNTPPVWADRDQLELVIMNLVVNARDAMPDGGAAIIEARVATRAEIAGLPAGQYVAISVLDEGIGMDEVTLKRAQEPFFSTKAAGHGTGLGLSMAYGFTAQSGGALLLSSAVGRGTSATIVLPAAQK